MKQPRNSFSKGLPLALFICSLLLIFFEEGLAQVNSVRAGFSKDTALIGDYLQLNLSATYNSGEVFFPQFSDSMGNGFEVIKRGSEKIEKVHDGKQKALSYTLIQFDAGQYQFAPMQVLYKSATGRLDTVYSNSFSLYVKSIAVDTTKDIKPAKPIFFPPYQAIEFLPLISILVILIGIILLAFYCWKKFRKKDVKQEVVTPENIYTYTLKELNKLKLQKLWTTEQIKEHHLKLSELLRAYLEIRYEILALESTSHEIMISLQAKKSMDKNSLLLLREVIDHCDLVKFAKWQPDELSCEKVMDDSILFVQQTKPAEIQKETKLK